MHRLAADLGHPDREDQVQFGENRFDGKEPTTALTRGTLAAVERYLTEGEVQDVKSDLPEEIAALV